MKISLGTMTFGGQVNQEEAREMLELFLAAGHRQIDTAYVYSQGRSEEILGRALAGRARDSFHIATKANPAVSGSLSAGAVTQQLEGSLQRLQLEAVDLFYLHMPDLDTPIEETLSACADLQQRGLFRELGLSNYAAWQVAEIHYLCQKEGWPLPSSYQGMYNAVTRQVEAELFPCLRRTGMNFLAYNPLAGGVLSGRYSWSQQAPEQGRFKEYDFYCQRYWKQSYIQAVEELLKTCADQDSGGSAACALRWLAGHSLLCAEADDVIILGASRREHLEANLAACRASQLEAATVAAFEKAWLQVKGDCPKYFRP